MKGDMADIFASLVFMAGVLGTIVMLNTYFIYRTGGVETPMENLESLQAAYAVESCFLFLSGENYITSEFLDSRNVKFVGKEDFCNIPYPPIHAEVTDMESGEKWEFTRPLGTKLKDAYFAPSNWLIDKFGVWRAQRQSSQPKHSIFIPIMYKNITRFGSDDVVFKNGRKYVVVYTKVHDPTILRKDDLKLDVHPIELYGKSLYGLPQIMIENEWNLTGLKKEMGDIPVGSQNTILMTNVYKDITGGDIRGSFGLAIKPSDCGSSSGKKICVRYFGPEMHGGKLYVKI